MINILNLQDAIHVTKDNGTDVNYYIFNEYEIHLNKIKPHSIQEWHKHSKIEEVILVTKGSLTVSWKENNKKYKKLLNENDLVQVKDSIHTFSNDTEEEVSFIVFRLLLDGKDKREIIKNDKEILED